MLIRSITTPITWVFLAVILSGCGNNDVNPSTSSAPRVSAEAIEVTEHVEQYIEAVRLRTEKKNNGGWTDDELKAIEKGYVAAGTDITRNLSTFMSFFLGNPEYRSQQHINAMGFANLNNKIGEIPYRIGRHQCHLYLVKDQTWLISDTDCTSPRLRGLQNDVFKGIFQ